MDAARERARRMVVRVYPSPAAQDLDDAEYWRGMPAADRVLQAWR